MKKPGVIDKRKVAVGVLVATMILAPVYFGWKYIEPLIFRPATQLFARLPVAYRNLSPIPIREKAIRQIPVRVIPKGTNGLKVKYKDLSQIKVVVKGGDGGGLEDVAGLNRVKTRTRFTRGLQPRTPAE